MKQVEISPTTDLNVLRDPDAARRARVLVSPGRIEIVLSNKDHEWVRDALDTLNTEDRPAIVIVCPE